MTCFLTCMFTLLLICLTPSKAMLSSPRNLTVGLLDFKATAEWLPGQGNPPGTGYTLEYIPAQNMSGGKWIGVSKCTDTDVQKCELIFDQPTYDLHWNYFVRVKSTFKGTSSNWTTTTKSFQPYGDTVLSSPDLKISDDQRSINISFSHWLDSNPLTKPLEYQLYLFENSPGGESKFVALLSTSKSPYVFHDMPSGRNYCISVSAIHQQASKNNNLSSTKCIFLLDSTRSFVIIVCIVAVLLIMLSVGLVVTFVSLNHTRPNIKNLILPSTLLNISETCRILPLIPEAFQTIYQSLTGQTADLITMEHDSASDDYVQRENIVNGIINPPSMANPNLPEQAEGAETSNQCYKYTLATDMEQSDESVFSENYGNMHSGNSESLTSNHSRSSETLQMMTDNQLLEYDMCYPEETLSNYDERALPVEEIEEEDVFFLLDNASESGYEPRHDKKV